MKKRRNLVLALLLVAAIALGVGYAAVSAVNFQITGTAELQPSQENFKVKFSAVENQVNATAVLTSDTTADMTVSNTLHFDNPIATATFVVTNDAASHYAAEIRDVVSVDVEDDDFKITVTGEDKDGNPITDFAQSAALQPGESMKLTVKVELLNSVTETASATINVTFKANPIEIPSV